MAKDPAILFYTSDFLSGTYTMSDEQVGKYIRLLCLQHQKGTLSEKDMINICKTYDVDIYEKFVCEDGRYYNRRLAEESLKRQKYSESRSKNRKTESYEKHMNNICKTHEKHMENENGNINENINSNKEGVIGGDWESAKSTFLKGDDWKYQFVTSKQVDKVVLEELMMEFVTDVELREDYKSAKELRSHFTNLYNKYKRNDTNRTGTKRADLDIWKERLNEYYSSVT